MVPMTEGPLREKRIDLEHGRLAKVWVKLEGKAVKAFKGTNYMYFEFCRDPA